MNYFNKLLKEDEELVRLIRPFFTAYSIRFGLASFIFLLPFFLLFWLLNINYGLIFFGIILLTGLFLLIRFYIIWYYNSLLISNLGISYIQQTGLWHRKVNAVDYRKIQDISYEYKGPWQMLWHFGQLTIQIVNSETILQIKNIKEPDKIRALILQLQERFLNK